MTKKLIMATVIATMLSTGAQARPGECVPDDTVAGTLIGGGLGTAAGAVLGIGVGIAVFATGGLALIPAIAAGSIVTAGAGLKGGAVLGGLTGAFLDTQDCAQESEKDDKESNK